VTRILAVDPSLTATGWALTAHGAIGWQGTWPPGDRTGVVRLAYLRRLLGAALDDNAIELVAIEGYAMAKAQGAHQLGELGGIYRMVCYDRRVPFVEIPPASVKRYATGNGNANKDDVLLAAVRRLGYEGRSKDEADALWILTMARHHYDHVDPGVPQTHLTGLAKVPWPDLPRASPLR
jgi:crossover junction endodeoxyribonuclease RuvC